MLLLFIAMMQSPVISSLDIDSLSHARFSGRGFEFDGHLQAAAYIERSFSEMGIPVDTQSFPITSVIFEMTPTLSINNREMRLGHDFQVYGSSIFGGAIEFDSVTDLGSQLLVVNDSIRVSPKRTVNQVVVIDEHVVVPAGSSAKTRMLSRLDIRLSLLRQMRAKMVLVRTKKLTMGRPPGSLNLPVLFVRDSISVTSGRAWGFSVANTNRGFNILAKIRGSRQPDSILAVSAHYDHLGSIGPDFYFPGANDNASGVAMMLNLARYFKENDPDYTLVFIAFSGEEYGLVGSKFMSENPLFDFKKVAFWLNLDMVSSGTNGIKLVNGVELPDRVKQLKSINSNLLKPLPVSVRKNAANSDHYWFFRQGVPGFFVYTVDGPQPYHSHLDRPETVDRALFKRVTRLMTEFLGGLQ